MQTLRLTHWLTFRLVGVLGVAVVELASRRDNITVYRALAQEQNKNVSTKLSCFISFTSTPTVITYDHEIPVLPAIN